MPETGMRPVDETQAEEVGVTSTQVVQIDGVEYEVLPASAEDVRYIEWGWETHKQAIPNLVAALQRVLTIDAGLIGGSIALLKDDVVSGPWRVAVIILLLASLLSTIAGLYPFRSKWRGLDDVKRFKKRNELFKSACLLVSHAFLFAGLVTAAIGVIMR
jgi:hypothetical protein